MYILRHFDAFFKKEPAELGKYHLGCTEWADPAAEKVSKDQGTKEEYRSYWTEDIKHACSPESQDY